MYKIAICDDDEVTLKALERYIGESFERIAQDYGIDVYNIGRDLLAGLEHNSYHAIFLDIDMPDKSGIEIANIIMKEHEGNNIIFVSNHEDMVYVSLRCKPLRFIRKSRINEEVDEAVEALCEKLYSESRMFAVAQESGMLQLSVNRIMYMESNKHYVYVHYDDYGSEKVYRIRTTLNEYEGQFPQFNFVRIHLGYLVNLKYIENVSPSDMVLDNGKQLPISRKMSETVKHKFLQYMRRDLQ